MYYSRNATQTVGTATVEISEDKTTRANSKRIAIVLINTSSAGQTITVAIDGDAIAGSGIVLSPGGYWQDNQDGIGYYPTQARITAVASAPGATLAIQERGV